MPLRTLLTPSQRRGREYLDEPGVNAVVVRRSMADVVLSNRLFGGANAVLAELDMTLRELRRAATPPSATLTMLDIGTGLGDIPARARERAHGFGFTLYTVGLDNNAALVEAARSRMLPMVRGDALNLPIPDQAVDIALCSQLLHHFPGDAGLRLLRELNRVARQRVIISDIRRSWIAVIGIWLASWALRFHPVSRHDGVVSVLRGFTRWELRDLVHRALGVSPSVRRRRGFRITASWTPHSS